MPLETIQRIRRLKAVERECLAVRAAVDRLVASPPDRAGVAFRDLRSASQSLEATYLIRLFAEFEVALRSYYATYRPARRPVMETLIDRIAARRRIPNDVIREAHGVRLYRNALLHAGDEQAAAIGISVARHHLCVYLDRLPKSW